MDEVDMAQARDEIGLADAIRAAREAKPAIVATGGACTAWTLCLTDTAGALAANAVMRGAKSGV